MVEIGYSLSCEEHAPNDLVRYAQQAEEAGFSLHHSAGLAEADLPVDSDEWRIEIAH